MKITCPLLPSSSRAPPPRRICASLCEGIPVDYVPDPWGEKAEEARLRAEAAQHLPTEPRGDGDGRQTPAAVTETDAGADSTAPLDGSRETEESGQAPSSSSPKSKARSKATKAKAKRAPRTKSAEFRREEEERGRKERDDL